MPPVALMMPAASLTSWILEMVPVPTMVLSKFSNSLPAFDTAPVMVPPMSDTWPVPSSLSEAASTSSSEVASMRMPSAPVPELVISLSLTSSSLPVIASKRPKLTMALPVSKTIRLPFSASMWPVASLMSAPC